MLNLATKCFNRQNFILEGCKLVVAVFLAMSWMVSISKAKTSLPVHVSVSGVQSVAISHERFSCQDSDSGMADVADTPLRAYRDQTGVIHGFSGSYNNFVFVGKTFLDLHRAGCHPMMRSGMSTDPSAFSDREWITSPYTLDGKRVVAVVHDEYLGWMHKPTECARPQGNEKHCWYFSSTLTESIDGGYTFRKLSGPKKYLASPQMRFSTKIDTEGVGNPTNIFRNPHDNYFYLFLGVAKRGVCLGRSLDLKSWSFWTGSDYSAKFLNPYEQISTTQTKDIVPCKTIPIPLSSIVYDPKNDAFIGVLNSANGGLSYTATRDLENWPPTQPLVPPPVNRATIHYPSILDATSTSRNFETIGAHPYLYFVSRPEHGVLRDVVRVPLQVTPVSP